MIGDRKILAVIPGRGGSKGLPGKNIRLLGGKPLIAWTIEEAKKSAYIDRLIVSSDDAEIIAIAERYGCEAPFVRPAELARDDTPGVEPPLHALEQLPGYDLLILLQPTSPLRLVQDIDGCLETCLAAGAPFCVSVTESGKSPHWMYSLTRDNRIEPFIKGAPVYTRRQDIPPAYAVNGAVYVADAAALRRARTFITPETVGYVMPAQRSLDIDSELDLAIAEAVWKHARFSGTH